jgi:hypothetical protein
MRGEAWWCALCWDMMSRVSPEPGVYVARYGWNGRSGGLIIGAAVFVLIAVTVPMSLALRVVTLVLFGGGALVFIASIATRRVALRVDARGITLGGSPGRYRSTTRHPGRLARAVPLHNPPPWAARPGGTAPPPA